MGPVASEVIVEHNLGTASLVVDGVHSLTIDHQMRPEEQLDLNRFTVSPCYTAFTSAVEITELRIGPDRNTLGYIFPITSFRNEMGFDKKFGLIYADAGFRKFVTIENLARFQSRLIVDQTKVSQFSLDEVVNDSLSILVLSKEIMEQHDIAPDVLELMLRRCQVEVSLENKGGPAFSCSLEHSPALNLQKPKIDDAGDLARLCLLLKTADNDNSEIGQFIQYYQFFEYMILKIFEWGIPHVATGDATPWDVKERLNDLGAERKRLQRLDTHCLPSLSDRESQRQLAECCKNFLDKVGVDSGNKTSWYSLLYLVRNSVVHNQFKLLSSEFLTALASVNLSLRSVSLDCFFNFEEPGAHGFFG